MNVKNIMAYIPMTGLDSAAFTGAYQAINTGTPNACFLYKIINDSTVDVTISLDGVTDMDFVASKSAVLYDLQTNSQPNNAVCTLAQGTIFYAKGAAGVGLIKLVGLYQPRGQ